ncbi:MAG: hypothetical protein P3W97_007415 [Tepidimonas sp.]|uniref:hypothetical protein n=1 Tax=Tepidimonas sp. TaxID=2002775 RepID=UPI00259EA1D4|nr:hypothetical protein [Tepidimonas sp.]MDM7457066.1 hypothetical protein [Tepidimonas sp.]
MRQGQREQDEAAGGRQYRELRLEDGTVVVVSVAARRYARTPDQSYGYLQFKTNGKTVTKYIGCHFQKATARKVRSRLHYFLGARSLCRTASSSAIESQASEAQTRRVFRS